MLHTNCVIIYMTARVKFCMKFYQLLIWMQLTVWQVGVFIYTTEHTCVV